jgi:hypothetical protein
MRGTTLAHRILSYSRDLCELASTAGQFKRDVLVSMTFGKYSADVDIILELTPLFKAAPDVLMSDLGRKCACPSRVGNIGR